jgi:hypothetical protein
LTIPGAAWLPDGKRIAFLGSQGTALLRGYIQDIDGGKRVPFTPPGVNTSTFLPMPVTPDGSRIWLLDPEGRSTLYPTTPGGTPEPVKGALPNEYPAGWTADGRGAYVTVPSTVPLRIFRLDLATGARTPWKEVSPSQVAGLRMSHVIVTPDGRTIVHSYSGLLSNLYIVDGVAAAGR